MINNHKHDDKILSLLENVCNTIFLLRLRAITVQSGRILCPLTNTSNILWLHILWRIRVYMRAITVWLLQCQHAAILDTIRTISLHKLGCFRLLSNSCWQSPVLSWVVVPCSLSILHVTGDHCVRNCPYSDTGSSTYIQGNHLGKDSFKTMSLLWVLEP